MDNIDHEIDDLLESFDFKPVTEGLGFYHSLKEKKQVVTSLNQTSDSLKADIEKRVNILKNEEGTKPSSGINRGELAPFYSENEQMEISTPNIELSIEQGVPDIRPAIMGMRTLAWLIDIVILATSLLVTFASIIFFAELPLEVINLVMISDQIFVSLAFISLMYYVFYFTFLDKTTYSTLGKNILGLKLISQKLSKNVSLTQSFFRVFLTLLTVPLLGLPLLLRAHDKVTETEVVSV